MNPGASAHFRPGERRRQGEAAEALALAYLESRGLCCLARNVRYRVGELDLVMQQGAVVVFVEVRYRSPSGFGSAASSVDHRKRQRLIRAARCWIAQFVRGSMPMFRFDVMALDGGEIHWIRDAFDVEANL